MEGAGVRLKRAFGYPEVPLLDPFLLLDEFRSDDPDDYIRGFPWHPHRGIETVTYMISGEVEHSDSLGNQGVIRSGDTQWMTAGSGIIHQEMPRPTNGPLWGFQLWVNLPSSHKLMRPRYRDVRREQVPVVEIDDNISVRVICGEFKGSVGPAQDIVVDTEYLDVSVGPDSVFFHPTKVGHKVIAYVVEGAAYFDSELDEMLGPEHLAIFGDGERIEVSAGQTGARFLLISGEPIQEPIAWRGPIVMNNHDELRQAFKEYEQGNFIKEE